VSLGFHLDVDRCSGCFSCAVACMDQNNLDPEGGEVAWRQVTRIELGDRSEIVVRYVSLACMNCEEAPCALACPTGAVTRDQVTGIVFVRDELCIGCHSCSMACPFGAPRFGPDGSMHKCDLCRERVIYGLEPACSRVCPTKALRFGDPNQLALEQQGRAALRLGGA
jgi:anaerobic dimethyl sulfoxide reductase subunit B